MLTHLIETITGAIVELIAATGYLGVFALMAIESACIPVPSEITMPFAGYLVSQQRLEFWLVVVAGGFGNLAGSLVAYWVGYVLEEPVLRKFIRNHGKWVLMSEHDYDLSEHWFQRHGELIVFGSRLLPIVRTFISLPAGVAKMNLPRFCIYSLVGSLMWSAVLTMVGVKLGDNWHSISEVWHQFDYAVVAALLAGFAFYLWHKRRILATWFRPEAG